MAHQLSDPQHKRPLAVGVTWAILVPVAITVLFILLKADEYAYAFAFGFLIYGLFLSTMLVLLIGLPLVLLLRRTGHLRGIYILLAAIVVGALAMGWIGFGFYRSPQSFGYTEALERGRLGIEVGAALGLAAGFALCIGSGIPLYRRPPNFAQGTRSSAAGNSPDGDVS